MALHLIPKPKPPKERKYNEVKTAPKPADMIQCPRCQGREVVVTLIGAMMVRGKLRGGTQQILCATCMLRGERVVLG